MRSLQIDIAILFSIIYKSLKYLWSSGEGGGVDVFLLYGFLLLLSNLKLLIEYRRVSATPLMHRRKFFGHVISTGGFITTIKFFA